MGSQPWNFRRQIFVLQQQPAEKNLKTFRQLNGGGKRDRTDDLLHAMQALSQLSYTPVSTEQVSLQPSSLEL
jgi:hypothetical protein